MKPFKFLLFNCYKLQSIGTRQMLFVQRLGQKLFYKMMHVVTPMAGPCVIPVSLCIGCASGFSLSDAAHQAGHYLVCKNSFIKPFVPQASPPVIIWNCIRITMPFVFYPSLHQ